LTQILAENNLSRFKSVFEHLSNVILKEKTAKSYGRQLK
ncbi:unnamed protein product, partial [Rotaria magnacalcarata]